MMPWNERALASTRGRVIQHLRRGSASVNDLAAALGFTDNAIRSHLAALERDKLVRTDGYRPGVRKPEVLYALAPDAEHLFPKAYNVLFTALLSLLSERLPPREIDELLRSAGRRIASSGSRPAGTENLRQRTERAVDVLKSIGGLADLKETEGGFLICGYSCPLADAVTHHPQVCQLAEALLSELIGAPVQEQCDRAGAPRCTFRVG